jgi:transmembrane sensor
MSLYLCKSRIVRENILKRLLKRYDEGTATKAERFVVDRWYDSFAVQDDQQIRGIENEQNADETARRIFSKINLIAVIIPWYRRPGFQFAGSIALISVLFLVFYARYDSLSSSVVYQTPKGQTQKILLKDGTSVWLNANSTLEVLPEFTKNTRRIKLTGEAYFEVKHDVAHPFVIVSQAIQTQVLGTSFNISAYPNLNQIRVTVRTGKVSVSNKQALLSTLVPGKSLSYNRGNHKVTVTDENPELSISWRDGRTLISDATFDELSDIFNNTLNVKLVTNDKDIREMQFRLPLDKKISIEENLNLIAGIHQLKYRRIQKYVIELYK